ncbi:LptA/OstA family protein [Sulfurovum sp.]|uniref:LptA/OstA family protein n=1 Tax=Sulfurovum sp. TaxID=1969726 RepID=UPI003567A2C8
MKFSKIILFFTLTQVLFAERMEITSASMEAEDQEVRFIGNAKVQIDDSWLHADKVIVYLDENNETKMYEATGLVRFKIKNEKHSFNGRANKVIYDKWKSLYVLRGKAVIDSSDFVIKRHVKGDEITLNVMTGRMNVKGGPIDTKFFIKLHDFKRAFGL